MQNDSILMQNNYMPVKVALKWLRVGSLTFQRSQLWHPLRFVNESRSFNIQIRGSIVVSISACHADDPGSIPGRGDGPPVCRPRDGGWWWRGANVWNAGILRRATMVVMYMAHGHGVAVAQSHEHTDRPPCKSVIV